MADERPLLEQLLDVALYAPIGAVVLASEQVPALVAKGRAQLEGQVSVARVLGRMAVGNARRRVEETVGSAWSRGAPPAGSATTGAGAAAGAPDAPGMRRDHEHGRDHEQESDGPARGAHMSVVPDVESLAIPGYGSLAASQVVERLDGLSAGELEAVRRYEAATRGRRTILGRISQLQGDASAGG